VAEQFEVKLAAMLWLCSEGGRYVTGSAIRVDAGANLR